MMTETCGARGGCLPHSVQGAESTEGEESKGTVEWEVTFRAMHPVTSSGKTLPSIISRTIHISDSVWGHLIFKIS